MFRSQTSPSLMVATSFDFRKRFFVDLGSGDMQLAAQGTRIPAQPAASSPGACLGACTRACTHLRRRAWLSWTSASCVHAFKTGAFHSHHASLRDFCTHLL